MIANVAERYFENYGGGYYWDRPMWDGRTAKQVHHELESSTGREHAEAIIGNKSWTSLFCSTCIEDVESVVVVDADESSVYICDKCLSKMRSALIVAGVS